MKHIEEALLELLTDGKPKIIALKGPWGVGKTYFWKEFLKEHGKELPFLFYSYCSLFGVDNLQELRHSTLSKCSTLKSGTKSGAIVKLLKTSKFAQHLDLPYLKNTDFLVDVAQEKMVDGFLLCFDDLERKEKGLELSTFLGFITSLRDEKCCTIILIFNDGRLEDDKATAASYAEYRDKCIDIELSYQPTLEQNFQIIFGKGEGGFWSFPNADVRMGGLWDSDYASLKEILARDDATNIRVLARIHRCLSYFSNHLSKSHPNLFPHFCGNAVKLAYLHFTYAERFSIEEILGQSYLSHVAWEGDKASNEEKIKRLEPVKKIQYSARDFDKIIVEYLESGFVDWSNYREFLGKQEERYKYLNVSSGCSGLWHAANGNFIMSQSDFLKEMSAYLNKNKQWLSLSEISSSVGFLTEIDPKYNGSALIDEAINRIVEAAPENLMIASAFPGLKAEVAQELSKRLDLNIPKKSILEAMRLLTPRDGCNPSDLRYLKAVSSEEFYIWLQSDQSRNVIGMVQVFLERFRGMNELGKEICERLKPALRKLAYRSKLDEVRVYEWCKLSRDDAVK